MSNEHAKALESAAIHLEQYSCLCGAGGCPDPKAVAEEIRALPYNGELSGTSDQAEVEAAKRAVDLQVARDAVIEAAHKDLHAALAEIERLEVAYDELTRVVEIASQRAVSLEADVNRHSCPQCGYSGCARGQKVCDMKITALESQITKLQKQNEVLREGLKHYRHDHGCNDDGKIAVAALARADEIGKS